MSGPVPIGLYVHWPYCARVCPYCDFNVVRARGREIEAEALGRALLADLRTQAARIGPRTLASIHFGGGTPSLMTPALAAEVIDLAVSLFAPAPDLEIGLEANPLDRVRLPALRRAGVERLSLGLQSLDASSLRVLGRDHDPREALEALEAAMALFPRVSLDAIYGRPGQTPPDWRIELAALAGSGVGHLSAYQLTYEPGTAFGRAADRGRLAPPDDEAGAAFWHVTEEVLTEAGLEQYEVSNWARTPADRSRHNLLYWRGAEYLGVGPGAHGRVIVDGVRRATAGARRPADYIRRVGENGTGLDEDEPLSATDAAEERLILGLRIDDGVRFDELAPLSLSPDAPRVVRLAEEQLIRTDGGRLATTPKGRALLDGVVRTLAA